MSSGRKEVTKSRCSYQEDHVRVKAYCDERRFKKSTLVARLTRDHLDNEGHRLQRSLPQNTRKSERK